MYFTTFNHDDDETIYYDESCLICWEPHTTNNYIYKMKTIIFSYYSTSCTCNGKFHHDCLLQWIDMSHTCPICRIKIDTIDDKKQLTFNIYNIYNIYIFLFKCLFCFCLLKTIFDIQYSVEKQFDDNQCHLN